MAGSISCSTTCRTDVFIGLLSRVQKRFGRVLMFADNAARHKSAKVRQYIRGCDGLRIEYFLPYTQELNTIETQWRVMKNAAGSRVYGDVRAMEDSIRTMIRQKVIVPVKLGDFLRC